MATTMARRATMAGPHTGLRATTANLGTVGHMLWHPNGDDARHGASASGANDSKVDFVHRKARSVTPIQTSGQEVRPGLGSLIRHRSLRRLMLHRRPPQAVRRNKTEDCSINWVFNRAEHAMGHVAPAGGQAFGNA
jgi:hypothetical protein